MYIYDILQSEALYQALQAHIHTYIYYVYLYTSYFFEAMLWILIQITKGMETNELCMK